MSEDGTPPLTDDDAPEADDEFPADDDRWVNEATGEVGAEPDEQPDPADPFASIIKILEGIHDTLASHQEQLEELADMLAAVPDGPWAWAALNQADREELWQKLYAWVAWLEDRYIRPLSASRHGIGAFAADWYRHPVAVEMLTALMVAHASAYRRKASAPSFTLVEWHERCLWPTLARIEALGLFDRESESADWGGPTLRPTRRDETRFNEFLTADQATSNATEP